MIPTKTDILKEDMAALQKDLDFLQQTVSSNDTWQRQLLWRHTKYMHDLFDYILTKGNK